MKISLSAVKPVLRNLRSALRLSRLKAKSCSATCSAMCVPINPMKIYEYHTSPPRVKNSRGGNMPNPRQISLAIHQPIESEPNTTLLLMQYGQFVNHDIAQVTVSTLRNGSRCCCCQPINSHTDCFAIDLGRKDELLNKSCIEFVRSNAITYPNGTVPYPRKHRNSVTAWLDASTVYGSTRKRAAELRSMNGTGALLKTSHYKGEERLPKGPEGTCINKESDHYCALSGDDRTNQQPALTAIHTLFHMEHNRLVRKLVGDILYRSGRPYSHSAVQDYLDSAPHRIQERLYQVVRKVLIGVHQHIAYSVYLPMILGPVVMTHFGLWTGRRTPYIPEIKPSLSEEFQACAYRFGHTLIYDFVFTDSKRLLHTLFSTSSHNLLHYNSIVQGMVGPDTDSDPYDTHLAESIVNKLFFSNKSGGLDLASLNIQRGRDHALPRHNEMRRHFGLKPYTSWKDYGDVWKEMKSVYEDMEDVECFPGGTAEPSVEGGIVGETFANVIGQQFHDLKYGDRYYFETASTYYGFTNAELRQIRRHSLNKILCEGGKMSVIQANPFLHVTNDTCFSNPEYPCEYYEDIDMWPWTYYFV